MSAKLRNIRVGRMQVRSGPAELATGNRAAIESAVALAVRDLLGDRRVPAAGQGGSVNSTKKLPR